jgi:hypothetical protein
MAGGRASLPAVNRLVAGSNPARGAKQIKRLVHKSKSQHQPAPIPAPFRRAAAVPLDRQPLAGRPYTPEVHAGRFEPNGTVDQKLSRPDVVHFDLHTGLQRQHRWDRHHTTDFSCSAQLKSPYPL